MSRLKKISWTVIIVISALTLFGIYRVSKLNFNYEFEDFFPADDPETSFYFEFRDLFETDNDFVIIALENKKGVFQKDFLLRADSLCNGLDSLPNVTSVISPTSIPDPKITNPKGKRKLIDIYNEETYTRDSIKIYNRPELIETIFSRDGKSIVIQVNHDKKLAKHLCDSLCYNLTDVLDSYSFTNSHAVGRSIAQVHYISLMNSEMILFMSLSIVLIIAFLFIAFRSWWGIWVPVTVVLLSIIWLLASMELTGKDIDLMVMILPTILFVVGMSDAVHIISKYFDELRSGKDKIPALKVAFKEIGLATLLTSVTTAIGFLTLLTSSIRPIEDFGIYSAMGVLLAFILAYSLLPAVLVLSKTPVLKSDEQSKVFWTSKLHRGFGLMLRNRKTILVISALVFGVSIYGLSKIEVNNFLLEDLSPNDPFRKKFDYLAETFSGARPFELAIEFKDGVSPWDFEALKDQEKLDNYLMNEYGVGSLLSHSALVKWMHRFRHKDNPEFYKIPDTKEEVDKIHAWYMRNRIPRIHRIYKLFYNEDSNYGRVNGKVPDLGSTAFFQKEKELEKFLKEELKSSYFDVKITGTARLIDLNNRTLARNMISGLALAFAVIALIVGLMFRSVKMVIISLVPNVFPLLVIGGVMGLAEIGLKVSTSIIFTIAFGIAVDDTIHFMTRLKLELRKGKSLPYALKRTFIGTGKAIIVTSLILCGGFLTLIASDFMGVYYIGLLISITLAMAVLADLFLLPLLIFWFYGKKARQGKVSS